jgi:hypothetical protein
MLEALRFDLETAFAETSANVDLTQSATLSP